ncbi:ubiquinol-cytochrome C chaperone family protein [Sneathiella marina]|uniref:Ubiquinol-cytochrome C chaperone family protein n=1 Tax=Sneathiella marina TaxID=2950108 RepID=A0ABY4VYQ7_9PROT|nr:ubiquinol-cytochrome C chaperone family protein [Sneathiella marina]USG60066.1 ubiquinol-cytochrome C chaperone family protein [Sneathiella marina]
MVFGNLFRRDPIEQAAGDLYAEIVKQARQPAFYQTAAVPDTIDGRYEMISLHAFLVMRHLKGKSALEKKLSQKVFDHMFADMDQSLREIGVGDLSVGKRIKQMAKVFYGRVVAYEQALDGGEETLEEALRRNHYGTFEDVTTEAVTRMAAYIRSSDALLATQSEEDFKAGKVVFGVLNEK